MMAHPPFMKHLPTVFKVFTSLDLKKEKLNNYLLLFKFVSSFFFIFSTLSCITDYEGKVQDTFPMYHDLLHVLMALSVEIFFVKNKSQVCTLFTLLMEPFEEFEPNTVQSEIVKDYNGEATLYGKVVAAFYLLCVPLYSVTPLFLLLLNTTAKRGNTECADLGLGWVSNSDSYWYILPVYIGSVVVCIMQVADIFLWHLLMAYTILKIKYTIRLLCADLDDMNRFLDWEEKGSESSCSSGSLMYWEEESMIRTAPRSNSSSENKAGRPQRTEREKEEKDAMNSGLQTYNNENILRERMKLYLENIVERHVNIIRYVKLTDKNFRLQLMVFVQLGVITVALAVPKLGLGTDLVSVDYISQGLEFLGFMTVIGVISYIGQTLLDESESLRQALYNCDWTDKPHSLRRDLLIMQIVATRPLKLTVGGIYTLGMETYSSIVRATYSYTSFLQSQN